MAGERYYHFYLSIDRQELMRLYAGAAKRLRVRSVEGPMIDLDANHLRSFTSYSGVNGNFRLVVTENNKFVRLERIWARFCVQ